VTADAAQLDAPERAGAPHEVAERLLSVEGLTVTYASSRGPVNAIASLSLGIRDREFVCVLGPSGCGKSTLLNIVAGLVRPTSGRVELGGVPILGPRPDIGVVFQQPTLLPWSTVLQNVLVPIRTLRLPVRNYIDRARALIAMVGLERFAEHYPHELSGGMQQRVGIARALVHDPKLLLMDEPFAALDAMTRERMSLELQRIWTDARKTVLFITHSIPEAVFLADRIIVMSASPGRIVQDLPNPMARPRSVETMERPEFAAQCTHLRRLFERIEVDRTA
jgi:NitT/TauT family transport system ATP-binding protein